MGHVGPAFYRHGGWLAIGTNLSRIGRRTLCVPILKDLNLGGLAQVPAAEAKDRARLGLQEGLINGVHDVNGQTRGAEGVYQAGVIDY